MHYRFSALGVNIGMHLKFTSSAENAVVYVICTDRFLLLAMNFFETFLKCTKNVPYILFYFSYIFYCININKVKLINI